MKTNFTRTLVAALACSFLLAIVLQTPANADSIKKWTRVCIADIAPMTVAQNLNAIPSAKNSVANDAVLAIVATRPFNLTTAVDEQNYGIKVVLHHSAQARAQPTALQGAITANATGQPTQNPEVVYLGDQPSVAALATT